MQLVDTLHQHGIGVIFDWVGSHFPSDSHALARFDGTALYEHEDPRRGFHPQWNSLIFNYSRYEVRDFLVGNVLFWLAHYHFDAVRVDAVSSMLYLDFARSAGEWLANEQGGHENWEAVQFLQQLNRAVYAAFPDVHMIAEESTAWAGVSRPVHSGGLGFGMKWNMGWMNDTLRYFERPHIHRRWHEGEIRFSAAYAFNEIFVLALSHDDVVYGKGNGEDNRDGIDDNRSWNCGAEGATQEAAILALRARQVRNLLTTLLLSHGTPLLLGGDEFGRTQHGNNNGYCQDSALTWHDWTLAGSGAGRALQSYVQALLALRRALPVVRPAHWPHEHDERAQCAAVRWFSVWGLPMSVQEWDDPLVRCVCAVMQARSGQSLMLLFNATPNEATFTLPQQDGTPGCWHLRIDTREAQVLAPDAARRVAAGEQVSLLAHSMVVLTGQALARSSESQA